MTTLNVGGRELALAFTLDALDAIEQRFGKPMDTRELSGTLTDRRALVGVLLILARQGAYLRDETPAQDMDETWLARRITPGMLPAVQNAVLTAILAGMRMESEQEHEDDEDVVLAELKKKARTGGSDTARSPAAGSSPG